MDSIVLKIPTTLDQYLLDDINLPPDIDKDLWMDLTHLPAFAIDDTIHLPQKWKILYPWK